MKDFYISFYIKFNYVPSILRYYKKVKNVKSSKSYVFIIGSKQQNIMVNTEKNCRERKSVPLVSHFHKKMSKESLPQV